MYGVIYKITDLTNDKIYIGKTTRSVQKRFDEHINCAKKYNPSTDWASRLYPAMKKHGIDNFIVEIIAEASSEDELNLLEQYWIKKLNSLEQSIGYNISQEGMADLYLKGISILKKQNNWCRKKLVVKITVTMVTDGINQMN